jgi:hypothetical protein
MDWFELLNTQEPGTFELSDPRSQDTGYGFDDVVLSPGQGNLPDDYAVTETGLIRDQAGNLGKFSGGQWTPYQGGDVNTFLGKAASGSGNRLLNNAKNLIGRAGDFATSNQGIMALLAALAAYSDRAKPSGGGVAQAYAGPKPITRTMTQGAYGPTAMYKYAAEGGLMQAYANGGKVQMEDGGFVMTKRAVDGAGGPRGIQQLVPGATMIRGPGTGTSDDIPAVINGRNGQTPARLSNGEAYVPKPFVDRLGGARQMYALMNNLQRRA